MKNEIRSLADLNEEEAALVARHMEENPSVRFKKIFKGWYDEQVICVSDIVMICGIIIMQNDRNGGKSNGIFR